MAKEKQAAERPGIIDELVHCAECRSLVQGHASMRIIEHLQTQHKLPGKEAERVIRWIYEQVAKIRGMKPVKAYLLRKKVGVGKFPDDDWREILQANGFQPSGLTDEVWRSPNTDIQIKIDVNHETEEPYYQVITEDGTRSAKWSDAEALRSIVTPKNQEPEPPKLTPDEEKKGDDAFLKSVGIVARIRTEKLAGRPPRFSFSVPLKAAGNVAFQLAKAGMLDFDVTHFKEDESSTFTFPNEPEMHVAEEIVKAEFADQISARKGLWSTWTQAPNPMELKGEKELHPAKQYLAGWEARAQGKVAGQWGEHSYDSDKVHDVLDKYRNEDHENLSFDNPVPDDKLPALLKELDREPAPRSDDEDSFLGVVVFLVTHGSNVPAAYRERARQIAFALVKNEDYLNEWQNPNLRRVELENEIEILEGSGAKTAEVAENYRRKKLLAWIDELGLDLSEELKQYDEGDFWTRDQVYERVRGMIKEERKFQSVYRRNLLGK